MDRLLRWAYGNLIRAGNLRVTTAGGSTFTLGDGTGKPAAIRFTSKAAERGVLIHPELRFGEAYVNGGITLEGGTIADVLAIVHDQPHYPVPSALSRIPGVLRYLYNRLTQLNLRPRARRNVAHHYDLDAQLYACSSTQTANTAAPISRAPITRSMMRSSPRKGTLPPSCW